MEEIYVGAYLEVLAQPFSYKSEEKICPECNASRSGFNFCAICGCEIQSMLIEKIRPAHLPGLLEIGDKYDEFIDALSQSEIKGPNGEIFLIGNCCFPENPDHFDMNFAEIPERTAFMQKEAFRENYREIINYLVGLIEKGHIISLQIKFGFLAQ